MTKAEAKKRIEKLREVISRHRYLYHVLDRQEIADEAFDRLKHELLQLEQQYPDLVTPDSPTQRVGGEPLDKFQKVEHRAPMLSIEDVFEEQELKDWESYLQRLSDRRNIEYFTELKVDGFAVSLLYRNGVFAQGATRGNGRVGEDVTRNLKTIESIPLKLELRGKAAAHLAKAVERLTREGDFEVRGEVYMEKRDFERFNRERQSRGEELYANPRNLAAGSIRQLDPQLAASRPLKFIAYDTITDAGQSTHAQEHEILRALGFPTDKTARVARNTEDILEYWSGIRKKRESFPFQVDGVVINVNDNALMEELGVAGKGMRGMRALKFAGKQATTRIRDIQVQVGRTGAVTPVAFLEPVQLAGVTVSRASLHNEDEIKRLGVKIGDTAVVERAGDVIPYVVQVLEELRDGSEKPFRMPKNCPKCGTKLSRPAGEVIWRCTNKNCKARKSEYLYHFVSRKAFDIEGLGPKIVDQLLDEHLIADAPDLFWLQEGDLVPLERFAEKSASNLIASIRAARTIPLSRFIYALGIRHVGEETARDLAEKFGTLRKLMGASREELEAVEDVGEVVAESIFSWFRAKGNQKFIEELLEAGVRIQNPAAAKPGKNILKGRTFVFTGALEAMSREEAKARVRALGGEVSESVSRNTDYVVVGAEPGSKAENARTLGVETLAEQEFLKLLG